MAMLSTEYNEALTGKVAERLGIKESLDKLSAGLGPAQTLAESANAGMASADKTYAKSMAAAQQQATAGVAQATAEKQALSDPGTLSAGQKSYLGQGYDEQAAQYRTAYDVAAEQAAATKKQAYANIYDTLNKSVNATSKQYTEFMTALLNSSYGIAALQKAAGLNGVDTTGWFTTKGDEYRAAHNLVGVDSSKFGAEKQALMDDKSLTWASATIAEDALESLGVYDANSEVGKLARYYLTNELYGGEGTWNQTWTQEERSKYLPMLDAFRQDVLGYTQESFATEKEQRIQKEAAAKEKANAPGATRYAGQSELGKGSDKPATGKAIKLTLDGTKYDVKLGIQATGDALSNVNNLIYTATGRAPQVGDVVRDGDKLYVVTKNGTFETGVSGSMYSTDYGNLLGAASGGAAMTVHEYVNENTDTFNYVKTSKGVVAASSVTPEQIAKHTTEQLPDKPYNGQVVTLKSTNGTVGHFVYADNRWIQYIEPGEVSNDDKTVKKYFNSWR